MVTGRRLLIPLVAVAALVATATSADTAVEEAEAPEASWLRAWHGDLRGPARLAVGGDDSVWVTLPMAGAVVQRSAEGALLQRREGLGTPLAIGEDLDGNLLLSDSQTGTVTAWTADWEEAYVLGIGADEFVMASDLAVDPDSGDIYVVDSQTCEVAVFAAGGESKTRFSGADTDEGGLQFPTGIALDAARDELWVVDQQNRLVRAFDLEGNQVASFGEHGAEDGELYGPQGLAVDDAGRVYVADSRLGRVAVFDRYGAPLLDIGSIGGGPEQHAVPLDVLIDSDSRLFVSSSSNNRLELWGVDDYVDNEVFVPAELELLEDPIDSTATTPVSLRIEVEGYRAADLSDVAMAGIAADTLSVGDADGDGVADVIAEVPRAALLDVLPASGDAEVDVTATLGALQVDQVLAVSIDGEPDEPGDSGQISDTGQPDTPDTGQPSDTGPASAADTGPGSDDEGAGGGAEPGCGCGAGPAPLAWTAWIAVLALARRRERVR